MPVELPSPAARPPKEWVLTGRFVLVSLLAFFAVVIAVNATMMTLAFRTFSGVDAKNGYEKSQNYNKEIAFARQQAERGWVSDLTFARGPAGAQTVFSLRDAAGKPVSGLVLTASLRHPTVRQKDHQVGLKETSPGVYQADEADVGAGAWDVSVTALSGEERVYVSESRFTLK